MNVQLIKSIDHYGNAYAPWGIYTGKDSLILATEKDLGIVKINNITSIYARNDGYIDITKSDNKLIIL